MTEQLIEALINQAFSIMQRFAQMRDTRRRAFSESPVRNALHVGSGYPREVPELQKVLHGYMEGPTPNPQPGILGIAAPHVSPFGGWHSYGAAYRTLTPDLKDRTFVILGTFALRASEPLWPYA